MRRPDTASSGFVRRSRRLAARLLVLALVLVTFGAFAALAAGCKRKADAALEASPEPPVVRDLTDGLQLTWIDDKGEFHVEQRVADVPAASRDVVRVRALDPTADAPSGDRVFVVDLRTANGDGTYTVRTVPRAEFEQVAVTRRAQSGTAVLAPKGAASAPSAAASGGAAGDVAGRPAVIIYGASWCGPCHQAAAYLKQKGVAFVEHDIERDSSKQREMQAKLAKAGVRGGSIPVLDVRGRILVGFDARAVDQALGQPL
jgi:glutaredoxin